MLLKEAPTQTLVGCNVKIQDEMEYRIETKNLVSLFRGNCVAVNCSKMRSFVPVKREVG